MAICLDVRRFSSFEPAIAIEKLLGRSKWRVMQFPGTVYQAEASPKLIVKRFGVVSHYVKAAAFRRPLGSKRADDHVAAPPDRPRHVPDIRVACFRGREEVEDRAIVPKIVHPWGEFNFDYVTGDPLNAFGSCFQAFLGHIDCGLRYIQNGDVLVASREEVIYESGFAPTNVYDGCGFVSDRSRYQGERGFEVGTIPTERVRRFVGVNRIPMCLDAHACSHFIISDC